MEFKESFDYSLCRDVCETYYINSPPTVEDYQSSSSSATAKPGAINGDICDIPDNPLCGSDFQFDRTKKDERLLKYLSKHPGNLTGEGLAVFFRRRSPRGQLEYCYTYDIRAQLITHACQKYQVRMTYHNMMKLGEQGALRFNAVDREMLLQSTEREQIE